MWPHRSQEMKLKHIAKQSFDKRVTTVLIRIPISLNQMFHNRLESSFFKLLLLCFCSGTGYCSCKLTEGPTEITRSTRLSWQR